MISEGSCDTENWSNDAENTALNHRNKLLFKIFRIVKSIFFYHFYQIYAALEHKILILKNIKILPAPIY